MRLLLVLFYAFAPFATLADEPIKIGATIPLSGNLATYGHLIRGGIELAAKDLKKEGIITELYFEDTPLSGAGVISSLNRLLHIDKVHAIAGNFSNVAMLGIAPIVNKEKIPTMHTSANDPLILKSGKYVASTNIRIKDEARHNAEYLFSKEGLKKAAVITIQTNFGEAYRDYFIERFKELGGEIVANESYEVGELNYKTQLLKIKSKKPDVVFAATFGHFLGYTLKQARELGITVPFYSVYESEDTSVLTAASGDAEGLRYFVTTSSTSSEKNAAFSERFVNEYQMDPGTFGSNAYDATILIARSMKSCNMKVECVLDKIYSTSDFPGVSGVFTMGQDGATTKRFILREVSGEGFKDVVPN